MNRAGYEFLARTALACDQNRCGTGRDLLDQRKNFSHGRRCSNQIGKKTLPAQLAMQALRFLNEGFLLNGSL